MDTVEPGYNEQETPLALYWYQVRNYSYEYEEYSESLLIRHFTIVTRVLSIPIGYQMQILESLLFVITSLYFIIKLEHWLGDQVRFWDHLGSCLFSCSCFRDKPQTIYTTEFAYCTVNSKRFYYRQLTKNTERILKKSLPASRGRQSLHNQVYLQEFIKHNLEERRHSHMK